MKHSLKNVLDLLCSWSRTLHGPPCSAYLSYLVHSEKNGLDGRVSLRGDRQVNKPNPVVRHTRTWSLSLRLAGG